MYPLSRALAIGLGYRLLLTVVLLLWGAAVPYQAPREGDVLYHGVPRAASLAGDVFVKWDSYWYLDIVARGYHYRSDEESNAAFLPAYPFAIKALRTLGVPLVVAGTAISGICFVALLVAAYSFGRSAYNESVGQGLVVFLCVFPSSWVFQMVYTESLFCATLFGFLVLYARGRYWPAAFLGFLLPLTRAAGLCVLVAVAADLCQRWRRERRFPRETLPALIGVLSGALAVGLVYWRISGQTAQSPHARSATEKLAGE